MDKKPRSLYNLATGAVIQKFQHFRPGLELCPENIIFDVFYEIFKRNEFDLLGEEFKNFQTFSKLLRVGDKRANLHQMLQAATKHTHNLPDIIAQTCQNSSEQLLNKLGGQVNMSNTARALEIGFNLGGFLCEAGCYPASAAVHRAALNIVRHLNQNEPNYLLVKLESLAKLLHSYSCYCQFGDARDIYQELWNLVEVYNVKSRDYHSLAAIYSEFSCYSFMRSQYHESYQWSMKAVGLLSSSLPPKLTIDALRQASKACVVKREFAKAEMLIKEAVYRAKEMYGERHAKYADCLIDYGFYLLNVDCISSSMQVYRNALDVRLECFGPNNLQVAIAHEDLAYATYVFEYSTGKFNNAVEHAEKSLEILKELLPSNHLLLASSKRVLALILEEIAIDNQDNVIVKELLEDAEKLHLCALQLAVTSFGECNVQTAKHYGNLGRLYQSMKRFPEAEKMHVKAIEIKESLLGSEDYEVALSVGHLASLYNYDMQQYNKAEELYLRSIRIGRKLFGPSYSGLEYDYRGLIQVYQQMANWEKLLEFSNTLEEWKVLRDERDAEMVEVDAVDEGCHLPLAELIQTVTSIPELSSQSSSRQTPPDSSIGQSILIQEKIS